MLRISSEVKSSIEYVPLKEINIQSIIRSFAADVSITQIFQNDTPKPIETIYYFPIEEQAAIYKFTAHIDDREIIAQLKEKSQLHNKYPHTSEKLYDTFLFEQNEHSHDTFIINIGVLLPFKECKITISYVTELDLIQGSIIRFVIPTIIAPRYTPKQRTTLTNIKSKYIQSIPYIINFHCHIEKLYDSHRQEYIVLLGSPSHHISVDVSKRDAYIVTFTQTNTCLDRDIILDIQLSNTRANTFVVVDSDAAMAAVIPFEKDCYLRLHNEQTNEFIFIVDCSGSMKNQNKIELARQAMLFFVRHLPKGCYFNIIKFGAMYHCLFNESCAFYNNIHKRITEKFINEIKADLGGTEILEPLLWLQRHPPPAGRARQVFLLTDGQVTNVSEVLEVCRTLITSTRIFSFGFGSSPSRSLIKGLARVTNGRFTFIPPNTSMDFYVKEQLEKAYERCIPNIRVQWNLDVPIETIPNQLSPAYLNDRLIIYALTKNQKIELNPKSSIEIRSDQSYYHLGIINTGRTLNKSQMIARLAAKALIIDLEHSKRQRFEDIDNSSISNDDDIKRRIIDLSLRYNILSSYTSFVGIEKHYHNGNRPMVFREIEVEISNDSLLIHIQRSRENSLTQLSTNIHATNIDYDQQHSPLIHVQAYSTKPSSMSLNTTIENDEVEHPKNINEIRSMDNKKIVEYLINKQNPDGIWDFNTNRKMIKILTGKPFVIFQPSDFNGSVQCLVTAIIIVLFEEKFKNFRSLWNNAVEKARQCLISLFNNDSKQLFILFRYIRIILDG